MTPTAVAAFDPIFWLHHANVDRHLALHQALYPDTFVESCAAEFPTYTIETGTILNAESGKLSDLLSLLRLTVSSSHSLPYERCGRLLDVHRYTQHLRSDVHIS